ncbi:alpha-amylase family protein [Novosphingobium flavum]|nr:alpha-amylase family protein [Novosphingobium flavum]
MSQSFEASRRQVLQGLSLGGLTLGGGGIAVARAVGPKAGDFDRRRWWEQDYRIVQTNLREIDALEDPREMARAVKDFGGTAIVSNIGGIVAFYPTRLPLQYKNPFLKNDFVKEMIAACHAEGLVYLGRFDTSKALKSVYDAHPDWFGIYADGAPTEFAGTYQACPNGAWLQDYALKMLREALTAYKPDGVFFNGVGFGVNDYAGRNRGFCVCNNCRTAFRKMYDKDLPKEFTFSDPNYRSYLEFQRRVLDDIFKRMHALADELIPGVPIFRGEDYEFVGRGELQRRVRRPAPEWQYQSGEQIRRAKAQGPGKPFSSTSTAHIDYPWRFVTETPYYHINRFAQMLGNGGRLDLYLMGSLKDQDDQTYLPPLSALFKWEAANSAHYLNTAPAARIGLYDSSANESFTAATPWVGYRNGTTRGAYSMLVDSRLPFQFVQGEAVVSGKTKLADFDVILAPNVVCMSDAEAAALDAFVAAGGLLVTSGMTAGYDEQGHLRTAMPLASSPLASFGEPQKAEGWTLDSARGTLRHSPNPTPIDGFYFGGPVREGSENLIPFIPDIRWGPPEYSYIVPGSKPREAPGLLVRKHGAGHVAHIPFLNEWQYYRDGLLVNQQLLTALVTRYGRPQRFVLEGDGAVELTVMRSGASNTLLHVINYAGQRNGRYDAPPALHGLSIGVAGPAPGQARALVSGVVVQGVTRPGDPGRTWYDLPPVGAFEALLLS